MINTLKQAVKKRLQPYFKPTIEHSDVPCMNCGSHKVVYMHTKTKPDFDPNILPKETHTSFVDRRDGICATCGFYQSYNLPPKEHLHIINAAGKDVTTSNPVFHEYPVDPSFIANWESLYFSTRLERWKDYLDNVSPHSVDRALFIRYFFGHSVQFIKDRYNCQVSGLDMSVTCQRFVSESIPDFEILAGGLNGYLEGDFLNSEPYDAVFVHHVLTHSADVHLMVKQIHRLLKPCGFVIFTQELAVKPWNPFHLVHMSEYQLTTLLKKYFDHVDRIDDCEPHRGNPYTIKGDTPDIVAWRDK